GCSFVLFGVTPNLELVRRRRIPATGMHKHAPVPRSGVKSGWRFQKEEYIRLDVLFCFAVLYVSQHWNIFPPGTSQNCTAREFLRRALI
ncbi:MAG: hypothetical protein IKI39_00110, partial [Oscillospiraceae bacterium]|nr:hypothetical protein [Oscillospiraceae bacterium]